MIESRILLKSLRDISAELEEKAGDQLTLLSSIRKDSCEKSFKYSRKFYDVVWVRILRQAYG